jgi:hypothetical protein
MADTKDTLQGRSRYLSTKHIEIPRDRYVADLELHDRFIGFSSELLRIALAGIAAVGFLIAMLAGNGTLPDAVLTPMFVYPTIATVALLACSAACALGHRFLASDGMFHHMRSVKLLITTESTLSSLDLLDKRKVTEWAIEDEKKRNTKLIRSERWLYGAGAFLVSGVLTLGVSFAGILLTIG